VVSHDVTFGIELKIIYLIFGIVILISYIRGIKIKLKIMMDTITLKDFVTIDGEKYWHYTFGGKYTSTKFVTIQGINYYNSNKPSEVVIDA